MAENEGQDQSGHPLFVILSIVFLDLVGVGILIPIVPVLLAGPSSPYYILPAGYTVQQGYILLGWLVAIYPLFQFLAAPILGQLSDKYGRKKVLGVSLAGTSVSYVVFAIGIITQNLPLLFVARAFDGITGGNIPVAQAVVADITPPRERAKNFGLIGAAFGLGFIIGPYIGGKLSDPSVVSWFNAAVPFWFAAILAVVNIVLVIALLP
ncbi:MAG: MFS transporter, partial [Halobacteriota archaeon]